MAATEPDDCAADLGQVDVLLINAGLLIPDTLQTFNPDVVIQQA